MKTNSEYMLREIAGESVLIPTGSASQKLNGMIRLTETAAFIWKRVDDSADLEEYATRPYIEEMTKYMDNAFVRPKDENYAMVSTQIQTIVEELVSGALTPEQASEEYATRVIGIVGEENVEEQE